MRTSSASLSQTANSNPASFKTTSFKSASSTTDNPLSTPSALAASETIQPPLKHASTRPAFDAPRHDPNTISRLLEEFTQEILRAFRSLPELPMEARLAEVKEKLRAQWNTQRALALGQQAAGVQNLSTTFFSDPEAANLIDLWVERALHPFERPKNNENRVKRATSTDATPTDNQATSNATIAQPTAATTVSHTAQPPSSPEIGGEYDGSGFAEWIFANNTATPSTVRVKLSNLNSDRVTFVLSHAGLPTQANTEKSPTQAATPEAATPTLPAVPADATPVDLTRYTAPPKNPTVGTTHVWQPPEASYASKPSTLRAISQLADRTAYLWTHNHAQANPLSQQEVDTLLNRFLQAYRKITELTGAALWGPADLKHKDHFLEERSPIHFLVYQPAPEEGADQDGVVSTLDTFSPTGISRFLEALQTEQPAVFNTAEAGFNRALLIRLQDIRSETGTTERPENLQKFYDQMSYNAEHQLSHLAEFYQRYVKSSTLPALEEDWLVEGIAQMALGAFSTASANEPNRQAMIDAHLQLWIYGRECPLPDYAANIQCPSYSSITAFFLYLLHQHGLPFYRALINAASSKGMEPIDEALRQVGSPHAARELFRRWGGLLALPTPNPVLYQKHHGLPAGQDGNYRFPEQRIARELPASALKSFRHPLPRTLTPYSHAAHAKKSVSGRLVEQITVPPHTTLSVYITQALPQTPVETTPNAGTA